MTSFRGEIAVESEVGKGACFRVLLPAWRAGAGEARDGAPGMDGWQLPAELQRDPELSSVPVVIVPADVRAEQEAPRLRVAGLLKKPL